MTKKPNKSNKKKPTLKDKISELESSIKDEQDKFLRLFAEFENYKRRTSKERLELYKTASMDLMMSLLPIIDDLERASVEFSRSKDKQLTEGFSIIKNKFNEILKSQGLCEIEVKSGDEFNVEKHEAITQIPAQSDKMKGKVVDVTEKGFKLGEKIIRYPKVVVGK
ncbi:MAG: nucleotide exchange factor GrpE [Flavobacteriaceae bacterium]|nr:nucleotide exchange factor GrpE [Flavobacteriaceae bacterium]|tara:strand:+ start:143 stop:640 length:498 start_codon:yes stop_codon:yes gene_type:complete